MKKNVIHIFYHSAVIVLSAVFALYLPETIRNVSRMVQSSWSYIENRDVLLVSAEVASAILLIVAINGIVRDWRTRRRARMATIAGLAAAAGPTGFLERRRIRRIKQEQGAGRSVLVLGATGFRTFVDPEGELHQALQNCREAKIMLLDPLRAGTASRAKSLADPLCTPESFRDQIIRSIDFLKGLKARQKQVRLKLYGDVPLMKLAIFGDYLFLQHYPAGRNVRNMPEYVFRHDVNGGLFSLFYQYFIVRWFDASVPEYDLDTDDLVYRDKAGNEVRREKFNEVVFEY